MEVPEWNTSKERYTSGGGRCFLVFYVLEEEETGERCASSPVPSARRCAKCTNREKGHICNYK